MARLRTWSRSDVTEQPDISVIVPFYNEEECAEFVLREIVACQPGDAAAVGVLASKDPA